MCVGVSEPRNMHAQERTSLYGDNTLAAGDIYVLLANIACLDVMGVEPRIQVSKTTRANHH